MKRFVVMILALVCFLIYMRMENDSNNARKLLLNLYNIDSFEDLEDREEDISKLVSDEVFEQLTNMDRSLNAYLKLQGNSSNVIIDDEKVGYIIYQLDSESITSSRRFVMFYETNFFGKIIEVREVEIVDFI